MEYQNIYETISEDEFQEKYQKLPYFGIFKDTLSKHPMSYCKAEIMPKGILGTIVVPDRENPDGDYLTVSYYLTKQSILFVDQEKHLARLQKLMGHVEKNFCKDKGTAHFFYEFLEYLIRDDLFYLQGKEKELSNLEENLDKIDSKSLTRHLMLQRRALLEWSGYYRQMTDLGETLSENPTGYLEQEEADWFRLFSEQTKRLMDHTIMLREYSLTIWEMFQTMMDIRQNDIMKVLTVVTTIFLPLSLIAAWYGMNFKGMPELEWDGGYGFVIFVSLVVLLLEIRVFKKKKWI